MAGQAFPYVAVHIEGLAKGRTYYCVGDDGVKEIGMDSGIAGLVLVTVTFTDDRPTFRCFIAPHKLILEAGEPVLIPDKPDIAIPHPASRNTPISLIRDS